MDSRFLDEQRANSCGRESQVQQVSDHLRNPTGLSPLSDLHLSPSLGLGKLFSFNLQMIVAKTFLTKWFPVSSLLFFKIKQSDCDVLKRVCFGPLKSFSFLADIIWLVAQG